MVAVLLIAAWGEEPARAQASSGTVSATAYEQFDASAGMQVRRQDGSALSGDIANAFTYEMRQRGIPVEGDAPYLLSFRMHGEASVGERRGPQVELQGSAGSASDEDVAAVLRMPLLEGRKPPEPRVRPRRLSVQVTDRENRVLWEGAARGIAEDDFELANMLIPALLDRLNKTVYEEAVR